MNTIGSKPRWKFPKSHILAIIFFTLIFSNLIEGKNNQSEDPLTPVERAWVTEHNGKIRLANAPIWPPLAFIGKDKISMGISPDYIHLIEKKLGFKFKVVHHDTWKEMLQDAMDKKVDVVGAIQKTPFRSKFLLFTKPFIKSPNIIVVRKDFKEHLTLDKMKGMKVAVGDGFAAEEYIRKNHSDLVIITVPDDYSLLKAVQGKRADAMVSDYLTVSYFMGKHEITDLKIAGDSHYDLDLRFSIRNDWPILRRILEKGMSLISPKEKEAIIKRWTNSR